MHSLVTGYMLAELVFKQKRIMPEERIITSWMAVDRTDEMSYWPCEFDNSRGDRRCGASNKEGEGGVDEEQGTVQSDAPTASEED